MHLMHLVKTVGCLVATWTFCINAGGAEPPNKRPMPQFPEQLNLPGGMHYSRQVPANFPLPVYKSNVVTTSFINPTNGALTANANIVTKDPPQTVFDWYRNECTRAGWIIAIPSDKIMQFAKTKKKVYIMNVAKEGQGGRIICYSSPDKVGTSVNVQWISKHKI